MRQDLCYQYHANTGTTHTDPIHVSYKEVYLIMNVVMLNVLSGKRNKHTDSCTVYITLSELSCYS